MSEPPLADTGASGADEPPPASAPPSVAPGDPLRKENARLARRIGQLENVLTQAEAIRDTNARLLDRVMGDLERERARSQELLRN
ncbi:MAG: hypothetical protein ACHQ3P_10515, partial [Candidatus Limnocylindrales bacterium]